MEALDKANDDIDVLKVNIKDWDSPVARQFDIQGIPLIMIYDGQGKRVAQGKEKMWIGERLPTE